LNRSSRSGFSIGSFEILASLSAEFHLLKETSRIAQNFVLSRFIHFASLRLQAIASDIGSRSQLPSLHTLFAPRRALQVAAGVFIPPSPISSDPQNIKSCYSPLALLPSRSDNSGYPMN
jgi:hypothetical protein